MVPQGKCRAYTRESPYTRIWEEKIAFGKKLCMFTKFKTTFPSYGVVCEILKHF